MKVLIDTQILIWFQLADSRLNSSVLKVLTEAENEIYVSEVSLFEITIKQTLGKLKEFDASIEDIVFNVYQDDFRLLPIATHHLLNYHNVPLFPEHRDPFDRLIVSIAKADNLTLISADEKLRQYNNYIQFIDA